jgi:hypothetical protein
MVAVSKFLTPVVERMSNFRFWHKADVERALSDVRFRRRASFHVRSAPKQPERVADVAKATQWKLLTSSFLHGKMELMRVCDRYH